jgi:proline iminopeptidase
MAMPVYTTMWGPNEFTCTGSLLEWDRTDRLGEITAPTLITVGEFDEVHPSCAHTLHEGIAGSELMIFKGCAHAAHLEDHERYRMVLRDFLDRVDASVGAEATMP